MKLLCQKEPVNEAESDLAKSNYNMELMQFVKHCVKPWTGNSKQEKSRGYFSQF